MAFTAADVKALRESTGAGMMDCKNALASSNGDMEKAMEFLREKGLAAAAKKAGRIAAEGMVYAAASADAGVVVEINSETDFVAKNAEFQAFAADVANTIIACNPADVDALLECKYAGGSDTVADVLREKVLTIGENIKIRRFALYNGGTNVPYMHMGGKIGVLLNIKTSDNLKGSEGVVALGRDLAMQIAAMSPSWLVSSEVPADTLEKEKEILTAQAINEGKPAQVAEKMVMGRIKKFYAENCLLEQAFVKDDKISVSQHVANVAKELGGEISIEKFTRFEKGEGLEKREDNFADEVASMVK